MSDGPYLSEEADVANDVGGTNGGIQLLNQLKTTLEELLTQGSRLDVHKEHAVADVHRAGMARHYRAQHIRPCLEYSLLEERLLQIVILQEFGDQVGD